MFLVRIGLDVIYRVCADEVNLIYPESFTVNNHRIFSGGLVIAVGNGLQRYNEQTFLKQLIFTAITKDLTLKSDVY